MNRRRSFEEGYGSFSDFVDEAPDMIVDELDMARKVRVGLIEICHI
jgi:hypothetical protein